MKITNYPRFFQVILILAVALAFVVSTMPACFAGNFIVDTGSAVRTDYVMVAGALYGSLDAILNGRNLWQGTLDGANFGAALPGIVTLGIVGGTVGSIYSLITERKITERKFVAGMSAGACLGGGITLASGAGMIGSCAGNLIGGTNGADIGSYVGALAMTGQLGFAVIDANRTGHALEQVQPSLPDYVLHNRASGILRKKYGPGISIWIGLGKETRDFITPNRCVEWRDLQNDWNGTFGLGDYF